MPPKPSCLCGACKKCRHREYMRSYYQSKTPEERRELFVAGRDSELVRTRDRARYHRDKHKHAARMAVRDALVRGDLVQQPCEVCGDIEVQGHHDDYDRPLDVRWLCRKHHDEHHWLEARRAA